MFDQFLISLAENFFRYFAYSNLFAITLYSFLFCLDFRTIYIYIYIVERNIRKQSAHNFVPFEFSFMENLGDTWPNFADTLRIFHTREKNGETRLIRVCTLLGRQGLNSTT